jgi:hypothetical protein
VSAKRAKVTEEAKGDPEASSRKEPEEPEEPNESEGDDGANEKSKMPVKGSKTGSAGSPTDQRVASYEKFQKQ